jgi:hypothetical protein
MKNISDKIIFFFIFFSLFLFIYSFYKFHFIYKSQNLEYYKFYFIFSFIFFFINLLANFLDKNLKKYYLIILFSTIISFYIFELYITLKKDTSQFEKNVKIYNKKNNQKFDTRSSYQVLKDEKKKNSHTHLFISPKNFLNRKIDIFPFGSIKNTNNIYCNENGYYSFFYSDKYGFRNNNKVWTNKEVDYLVIGDSNAHGACLNDKDTIINIFGNLSQSKILNLSAGGSSTLMQYAILKEYFKKTKKILIFFSEVNDLYELEEELKNSILKKYLNENFSQNLTSKQNEIDLFLKNFLVEETRQYENINIKNNIKVIKKKFIFKNYIKLINTRYSLFHRPKEKKIYYDKKLFNNFEDIVIKINTFAKKNNSKLYFIYLPSFMSFVDNSNYNPENRMKIKKIIKSLDIEIIDMNQYVFKKKRNALSLFPFGNVNGHYNIQGSLKIAHALNAFFKSESLNKKN